MIAKGKSMVSKGKTVKMAVQIALDLLDEQMENVEIEIIENETKGIFGLGSKHAMVRVIVIERSDAGVARQPEATPSIQELEDILGSLDLASELFGGLPVSSSAYSPSSAKSPDVSLTELSGKVWVKDGQLFCKDAKDKYPVVDLGENAVLYKNGERIEKTAVVSENDELTVEVEDVVREPKWEIDTVKDGMEAVLRLVPGARINRRLKDQEPAPFIKLEVSERHFPLIIEMEPIMAKLRKMGITHGIDYMEIASACASSEPGTFVIAKGTDYMPGKNGCFQALPEIEIKRRLKERSDGTVDYREIQEFPSVERGQVLGIVHPPIPGYPGATVSNTPVPPPEVFPLTVQEGKGVSLVEDGYKVIAIDAGHPDIKIKGNICKISVIPKLLIPKDVTLEVGNVHYIGNVEIAGSIQDGMAVTAKGNLLVHSNINMANVSAGHSIIVKKNIITSQVSVGYSSLLLEEIGQLLVPLVQQMKMMIAAINQLSTVSAFKASSFSRTGLGPLIKILCDGKYKSFPPLLTALLSRIKNSSEQLEEEWVELAARLQKGFKNIHTSEFRSVEDITNTVKQAEDLLATVQSDHVEKDCFLRAAFIHNSLVYSSGSILVTGKGVYNSKIRARGFVEVEGTVRGGEIFAAQGIRIGEAGTKGGNLTKIAVPHGQTIQIKTALEDTILQVGSKTHKLTDRLSDVFARVGEDGRLHIS